MLPLTACIAFRAVSSCKSVLSHVLRNLPELFLKRSLVLADKMPVTQLEDAVKVVGEGETHVDGRQLLNTELLNGMPEILEGSSFRQFTSLANSLRLARRPPRMIAPNVYHISRRVSYQGNYYG